MQLASIVRGFAARLCGWAGLGLALITAPQALGVADVLILGSSVSGGVSSLEAQTVIVDLGLTVDIVTDAQWAAMTPGDFAAYRAIIIGDPTCGFMSPVVAANACVWNAQVDGNVIVISTDPVFHQSQGGGQLTKSGVAYACADPTKTGAYICLSCQYSSSAPGTPIPELVGFCGGCPASCFTTTGALGCFNNTHIVATSPALTGLTDAHLANWSCSVHGVFDSWAPGFIPLAIALDPAGPFTAGDGTVGFPYIVARGDDLTSVGECAAITEGEVLCNLDESGTFTYTFDLTNTSGVPVKYLLAAVPPSSGVTVSPSVISLPTPLADGDTTSVTLTFSGGTPGEEICFLLSLNTADFEECCSIEECIEIPECDCLQLHDEKIECVAGSTGFSYTVTFDNLTGIDIYHAFLIPVSPATLTFTPDHFDLPPVPDNGSFTLSTIITGGVPGEEICFLLSVHSETLHECCALEVCITVPDCSLEPDCPGVGDCCVPHPTGGCDNPACCDLVCSIDPACCLIAWDDFCAAEAQEHCPDCASDPVCGDGVCDPTEDCASCPDDCGPCPPCPGEGDCCVAHRTPGCADPDCCAVVCAADAFCCEVSWDDICASLAVDLCGCLPPFDACPARGDCCTPHGTPGCDNPDCCAAVCAADAFCCDTAWDSLCVDQALAICGCVAGSAPCPGDINFDGEVDGADLGLLLAAWGSANRLADLNADAVVDGADLGLLLSGWGPCPR
jgi:hypothetical protein